MCVVCVVCVCVYVCVYVCMCVCVYVYVCVCVYAYKYGNHVSTWHCVSTCTLILYWFYFHCLLLCYYNDKLTLGKNTTKITFYNIIIVCTSTGTYIVLGEPLLE